MRGQQPDRTERTRLLFVRRGRDLLRRDLLEQAHRRSLAAAGPPAGSPLEQREHRVEVTVGRSACDICGRCGSRLSRRAQSEPSHNAHSTSAGLPAATLYRRRRVKKAGQPAHRRGDPVLDRGQVARVRRPPRQISSGDGRAQPAVGDAIDLAQPRPSARSCDGRGPSRAARSAACARHRVSSAAADAPGGRREHAHPACARRRSRARATTARRQGRATAAARLQQPRPGCPRRPVHGEPSRCCARRSAPAPPSATTRRRRRDARGAAGRRCR